MAMYDYECPDCGRTFEMRVPVDSRDCVMCNSCGTFVRRIWTAAPHMHDDSIPGGMWIENLGPQPMRFYSKSEYRDAVKARGLMPMVRHVGKQGSDKNPGVTSRWI